MLCCQSLVGTHNRANQWAISGHHFTDHWKVLTMMSHTRAPLATTDGSTLDGLSLAPNTERHIMTHVGLWFLVSSKYNENFRKWNKKFLCSDVLGYTTLAVVGQTRAGAVAAAESDLRRTVNAHGSYRGTMPHHHFCLDRCHHHQLSLSLTITMCMSLEALSPSLYILFQNIYETWLFEVRLAMLSEKWDWLVELGFDWVGLVWVSLG